MRMFLPHGSIPEKFLDEGEPQACECEHRDQSISTQRDAAGHCQVCFACSREAVGENKVRRAMDDDIGDSKREVTVEGDDAQPPAEPGGTD